MFSQLTNQQEQLDTISWSYQAPVKTASYSPAAWKLMFSLYLSHLPRSSQLSEAFGKTPQIHLWHSGSI